MTENFRVNLVACTDALKDIIASGASQHEVAGWYALAIKSKAEGADDPNWLEINRTILGRWKMSGLERIKKRAFDILRGKVAP